MFVRERCESRILRIVSKITFISTNRFTERLINILYVLYNDFILFMATNFIIKYCMSNGLHNNIHSRKIKIYFPFFSLYSNFISHVLAYTLCWHSKTYVSIRLFCRFPNLMFMYIFLTTLLCISVKVLCVKSSNSVRGVALFHYPP